MSPCWLKEREVNVCVDLKGRNGKAHVGSAVLLWQKLLGFLPPSEIERERYRIEIE